MVTLAFKWSTSRGRDSYGYTICTLLADGCRVARCNGGGYDMKGTCLGSYIAAAYADRLLSLRPEDMPEQSHWERAEFPRQLCTRDGCLTEVISRWIESHPDDDAEKMPESLIYFPCVFTCCPHCGAELEPKNGWANSDGRRVDDGRYFYGLRFVDPSYDPLSAVLEACDDTFTDAGDVVKTFRDLKAAGKLVDLDIIRRAYKEASPVPTARHTRPAIDGACGMSSVEAIMRAIGLSLEWVNTGRRRSGPEVYVLKDSLAIGGAA